jgi:hypothetical protein
MRNARAGQPCYDTARPGFVVADEPEVYRLRSFTMEGARGSGYTA